ncbi:TonB-dependent receptor [Chromobacterium amazonense]|uniref:TonB-dependent receptor n=1 Tax=Chromobacterium amazonense TaxID=1382803 RepID=UPI0009F5B90A|nr:TonB-dependent receptor [Chromobacterium amazonense]
MNYKRKTLVVALSLIGSVGYMPLAHADSDGSGTLDRVEVTGSNIKHSIKKEQASPVTIVSTSDLAKQGITTVEQVVNTLSSNQSSQGSSQAAGSATGGASFADMRGLGQQYTLVLLDGRRLPTNPFDGTAVDLNAIPLAAIDRVEVLRDGASAIYGTDAIGGVINFITKKTAQGLSFGGDLSVPQHSGGKSRSVNASYGYGNLASDGFNVFGAVSYQKIDRIMTMDRKFASTVNSDTSTSSNTFPSNVRLPNGTWANNTCLPPYSVASGNRCIEYPGLYMGITPDVEQVSGFGKGSLRIGDSHELSLTYSITRTKNTSYIAPDPTAYDSSPGHPILPGGGQLWSRSVPLGDRVDQAVTTTQNLQLSMEGLIAGWDYKAGLGHGENYVTDSLVSGWISGSAIQNGINNNTFNPFDQGYANWEPLSRSGQISEAKTTLDSADFKVSKELTQLAGGPLGVAFGTEYRRESMYHNYNYSLSKDVLGTGQSFATNASGSRDIYALSAEMNLPLIKNFEAQLAARYDHYSDAGGSLNPKVALRFQPDPKVMFRASASTGFRAPSLYQLYEPFNVSLTGGKGTDPIYCPNGVQQPGAGPNACVPDQYRLGNAGSANLKPEKASSMSIGMVLEPVKNMTTSVDLWWTMIHDAVGQIPWSTITDPNNAARFSNLYVRDPATNDYKYINLPYQNLGSLSTAGLDFKFSWQLPATHYGIFSIGLDGTYTSKYLQDYGDGLGYQSSLGQYNVPGSLPAIFRWQHELTLGWNHGAWSGVLSQNYKSGYTDANPLGQSNMVRPYSTWNLSGTYVWDKKLSVTLGVKNLFDQNPPYSNQQDVFQQGYDPRVSDPTGRAYFLKANYKM